MSTQAKTQITIEAAVNAPVEKVWEYWTSPEHIVKWNAASDDWHTTKAENDLRVGGSFSSRMEAKDGSFGFDFGGTYDEVETNKRIAYTLGDGRKVSVDFTSEHGQTKIVSTFEAEETNPIEMQRGGWQAILDNFKKYTEASLSASSKLFFEININAPVEKVYSTMLGDNTYQAWTAEFNPTSNYEGSWEKGSKILFIGTDEQGNKGGMVSRIKENIPNEYVSIEHLGILQGEEEITSGPAVEGWAGALENYTFKADDGGTLLKVDMDSNEAFKSYFEETWPKALNKLKELSEA